jgi:hypothetical protein
LQKKLNYLFATIFKYFFNPLKPVILFNEIKMIRLASIDIGYCNFAQYVEEFSINDMRKLEGRFRNLPSFKKNRVKGVISKEVKSILHDLCTSAKRIQIGVYSFAEEETDLKNSSAKAEEYGPTKVGLNDEIRVKLLKHLNNFIYLWDTCDIFVIEEQFYNSLQHKSKGRMPSKVGCNIGAVKVAESVYMWLFNKYFPFKIITYFGSRFKTQILGAPAKLNKPQRKQWSVENAKKIFNDRDDKYMINIFELSEGVKRKQMKTEDKINQFKEEYSLNSEECSEEDILYLADKIIREKQKLDDPADTVNQAQAFKFKTMIAY